MRSAALLIGSALALAACRPPPPEVPPPLHMDCRLGFDALAAQVAAVPGIRLARTPQEPYHYFNTPEGEASYVVTLKGGAGHPAIIAQYATANGMVQFGCPYGDKAGYDKLVDYLRVLAKVRRR